MSRRIHSVRVGFRDQSAKAIQCGRHLDVIDNAMESLHEDRQGVEEMSRPTSNISSQKNELLKQVLVLNNSSDRVLRDCSGALVTSPMVESSPDARKLEENMWSRLPALYICLQKTVDGRLHRLQQCGRV